MINTTFMKYLFLLIVFCVLFSGLFNQVTEPISFKFITGLQTLYVVIFLFQLIYDTNVDLRALTITTPKTKYIPESNLYIPLIWIILPGIILQLISSVFMTTMANFMKDKYQKIHLTRHDQWKLMMYKSTFIVATFSLMILTYSYCVDFTPITPLSGMYKTWLLMIVLISSILPVMNLIISNKLSSIIHKTTE